MSAAHLQSLNALFDLLDKAMERSGQDVTAEEQEFLRQHPGAVRGGPAMQMPNMAPGLGQLGMFADQPRPNACPSCLEPTSEIHALIQAADACAVSGCACSCHED
jgi:hypothetical protein